MTTNNPRPLGLVESIAVPEMTEARLRILDHYDMSAVTKRIKRKQTLPEHLIEQSVAEFKRLMALCVLGHRGIVVPCEEVDEVWHTFILFTREYADFCQRVAGGYLHHSPPESGVPPAPNQDGPFLSLYARYFGPDLRTEVQKKYLTEKPSICQSSVACGVE